MRKGIYRAPHLISLAEFAFAADVPLERVKLALRGELRHACSSGLIDAHHRTARRFIAAAQRERLGR
jgi:hypothetical protein